ncbi:hypothetical protein [Actinomadura sp. 6N118]|uniref:hypothetical protein n=1 Tax=Actinomadura sp. 6N118 TaxID=3375151 RepID=UPI0037A3E8DD
MEDRPADRPGTRPGKAPGPAGQELTADERAKAAGTGDAAVTGDTRVAGPAPESDVATAFPNPRDTAKSEPVAKPEAATKPGPVPVPEAEKPSGRASEERIERLMDAEDADRFHARWRDLQSAFVDDPQDAVRKADELTTEVVEAIKTSVGERKRSLDERWRTEKDAPADTERHRLALRAYRDLLERLLSA